MLSKIVNGFRNLLPNNLDYSKFEPVNLDFDSNASTQYDFGKRPESIEDLSVLQKAQNYFQNSHVSTLGNGGTASILRVMNAFDGEFAVKISSTLHPGQLMRERKIMADLGAKTAYLHSMYGENRQSVPKVGNYVPIDDVTHFFKLEIIGNDRNNETVSQYEHSGRNAKPEHGESILYFKANQLKRALLVAKAIADEMELCHTSIYINGKHHKGIVHRDLKGSNVSLEELSDDHAHVRILDWTLACEKKSQPNNYINQIFAGTPPTSSPEQLKMKENPTPGDDIWSLGHILYKLVHHAPIFENMVQTTYEHAFESYKNSVKDEAQASHMAMNDTLSNLTERIDEGRHYYIVSRRKDTRKDSELKVFYDRIDDIIAKKGSKCMLSTDGNRYKSMKEVSYVLGEIIDDLQKEIIDNEIQFAELDTIPPEAIAPSLKTDYCTNNIGDSITLIPSGSSQTADIYGPHELPPWQNSQN